MSDATRKESGTPQRTNGAVGRYDAYEITVEETVVYKLTRDTVKWTEKEWAAAVEAALANETLHEAWDNIPAHCSVEGYVEDVRTLVMPSD